MLGVYLIDNLILRLIESAANRLLRVLGGPHHVPLRNEDLVWY